MNLQVQPDVTNLAAGVYSGTVTLQFPQDNVTRQVTLLLVVATSATEIAQVSICAQDGSYTMPADATSDGVHPAWRRVQPASLVAGNIGNLRGGRLRETDAEWEYDGDLLGWGTRTAADLTG